MSKAAVWASAALDALQRGHPFSGSHDGVHAEMRCWAIGDFASNANAVSQTFGLNLLLEELHDGGWGIGRKLVGARMDESHDGGANL